jgi:transposase
VARKTYSEEFRRDAVELYRSTPGATVVGIAADLGIMDTTLSAWLKAAGVALHSRPSGSRTGPPGPDGETPDQELARLRARVAELEAAERKLNSERDILRAAAKYFAGETRW